MHISEGILSVPVLATTGVLAAGLVIAGFKQTSDDQVPRVAVFSALFFLASFIHIPVGPTQLHLILNGLIGAVLGIRAFPALFLALLLQGLLRW